MPVRKDPIEITHAGSIKRACSQEYFQPLAFGINDGLPYPTLLHEPSPL